MWARASVITSRSALLWPGHEIYLPVSLRALASQQSELGAIPDNVRVATGRRWISLRHPTRKGMPVSLRPKMRFWPKIKILAGAEDRSVVENRTRRALQAAQKYSLIANSIKSQISIQPLIETTN